MRYVGILIMSGALIGGGFAAAEKLRERMELLLVIRQMTVHLKGQILYSNCALPEAMKEIGNRFSEREEGILREPAMFFLRVAGRMEQEPEQMLRRIWKEEADKLSPGIPLTGEDRKALTSLGGNLGYADRSMQEKTILFYLEQVDDAIASLKSQQENKTRLYRCLGMAAGLFLMIVMA